MKTLTLIRHAKSDWSIEWQSDFERGLAERWKKQIEEMGKIMKKLELKFDYIICSPANRAVLTFEWLSKKYEDFKKNPTIFVDEIYKLHNSIWDGVIEIIKKIDNNINSLAIIWHNPLFNELIKKLTNIPLSIPTLWIIRIEFDIDSWDNISKKGEIKMFLTPKE
jgi:phosphohistidine phosphatase